MKVTCRSSVLICTTTQNTQHRKTNELSEERKRKNIIVNNRCQAFGTHKTAVQSIQKNYARLVRLCKLLTRKPYEIQWTRTQIASMVLQKCRHGPSKDTWQRTTSYSKTKKGRGSEESFQSFEINVILCTLRRSAFCVHILYDSCNSSKQYDSAQKVFLNVKKLSSKKTNTWEKQTSWKWVTTLAHDRTEFMATQENKKPTCGERFCSLLAWRVVFNTASTLVKRTN